MLILIHFINGNHEHYDVTSITCDKIQMRIETKDEVWFFNLSEIDSYSITNIKE